MYACLIPHVRNDGHLTTAQEIAEKQARETIERKPIDDATLYGPAEHFTKTLNRTVGHFVSFFTADDMRCTYGPHGSGEANTWERVHLAPKH